MSDITVLRRKIRNAKNDISEIKEILIAADAESYKQYKEQQRRLVITRITQLAYGQMLMGVFLFCLNMYFPFIERPTHFVLDLIDGCDAFGWLVMAIVGIYVHHLFWKTSHVTIFREVNRKRESLGRREERTNQQQSASSDE